MLDQIDASAEIGTDRWGGYKGLKSEFPKLVRGKSEKKGQNIPQLHRTIMMIKAWLRGVHHSVLLLQSHINEYTSRFKRHKMKEGVFKTLIEKDNGKTSISMQKSYLSLLVL